MTTRDDLYHLVDRIDPGDLDAAAAALLPYAEHTAPPMPASLGMGHSGREDLAERSEEILTKTGFGR
jgi:hypothetical protein